MNMELHTKITFLGSMIPKLPLFVILAIFGGGHIGFQVMWTMCAFFQVHKWIDHTEEHGIRQQDELFELNDTTVILVLDFGSFGWRPYWIPGHLNSWVHF